MIKEAAIVGALISIKCEIELERGGKSGNVEVGIKGKMFILRFSSVNGTYAIQTLPVPWHTTARQYERYQSKMYFRSDYVMLGIDIVGLFYIIINTLFREIV